MSVLGVIAVVAALVLPAGGSAVAAGVPSPPRNVAAVGGPAVGQMTVTWTAPATPNGTITSYEVATATDGGAFGAPVSVGNIKKKALPCAGVSSCSFEVYATNASGQSAASAPATGVWAVPGAPKASGVTPGPDAGEMVVKWAKPTNTGGRAITNYQYDVQVNGAGPFNGPFTVPGGAVTTAHLPCGSVSATGSCAYRLYAQNSVGLSAVSAAKSSPYAVPGTPTLLSATPGRDAHTVKLLWQAPPNTGGLAITSYTYMISIDGGAYVSGGTLAATPTNALVPCNAVNNCSYRIIAVNAKGISPQSNIKTTAYNASAAPVGLAVRSSSSALGSGAPNVSFTWSAPGSLGGLPVDHYEVRQCSAPAGGSYTGYCGASDTAWASATVVSVGSNTSFASTCPAGLVTCSFEVRAVNAVGPSPWAKPAFLTPFAPTNFSAIQSPTTAGGVLVSWTGPSEVGNGIDHYVLYSCLTSSGCNNSANWSNTGLTIPAGTQTATHTCGVGLQCNYRLAAVEIGTGASSGTTVSASNVGSSPPQAPQNLTASTSATTIGAVDLAWQAPASSGSFPITDYVFERSVNGGPFSSPISTGGTALAYTDTACGAANTCTYHVAAVAAGTGAFGNTATAEGASVPSAPRTLAATPGTSFGAVDLTWQAPLDNGGRPTTAYVLERSIDGGSTWPTSFPLGAVLSYTDTTCGSGTSCTYRVSATNSLGTGAASNTSTAVGTNLSPPQNLTAVTNSDSSASNVLGGVDLSWQPPASDSGFPIQGYEFRFQTNAGPFTAWTSTGTGTGTSFIHVCGQNNTCNYEVRAFNAIGTSSPSNQASALGRTDNTPPAPSVTTPANNARFQTRTPTISGTAGNATGDGATLQIVVKQGASTIRTFTVTRSGSSWTLGASDWAAGSPNQLGDGTYTVTATQSDWASNVGVSPATTFTVDNVAPVPAITAPATGTNTDSQTSLASSGTAGNAAGDSTTVTIKVYACANCTNIAATQTFTATRSGTTWSTTAPGALADGDYTLQASQSDDVGNTGVSTVVLIKVNNAVFVSTTGNDANAGTAASPKRNVATGITTAVAQSRPKVIIASGVFGESLSISGALPSGFTVLGGYTQGSTLWSRPGTAGTSGTVTQTATKIQGAGQAALVNGSTMTFNGLELDGLNTSLPAGASVYGVRAINSAAVTLTNVRITAASAIAGGNGTGGSTGGTGAGGANGQTGCDHCGTTGGAGGATQTAGGKGGDNPGRAAGNRGFDGTAGSGAAAGGTGGNGGCLGYYGGCKGLLGTGGGAGGNGGSGAAGPTNDTAYGSAFNNANGSGGTGATGATGGGGGGGGAGGGGCDGGACIGDWLSGGSGGGAGGGGGGGTGGTGGGGGGGSFGVYSFNSTVTIDASTTILTSAGGGGGTGANGGNGGNGGGSGKGGDGNCTGGCGATSRAGGAAVGGGAGAVFAGAGATGGTNGNDGKDGASCCNGTGGSGGSGGGGGGGGAGGRGGGGAGGPSVGTLAKGSGTITTLGAGQFTIGSAGTGGVGGNNGAAGVAANQKVVP